MNKFIIFILSFFILGCSTKEFEPKKVCSKKLNSKIHKELYNYTKKAETFRILKLKYVKKTSFLDNGVRGEYVYFDEKNKNLGKYQKINKDLATYSNKLLILDQNKTITLPYMVYSAVKKGNKIAIVFENNAFGIYSLKKNKLVFYQKDDNVVSSKYLGAFPIFYEDLVLFPLLNGKIAIVDVKSNSFIRYLDISDDSLIDNVIYLKIVNNNLFMATPKKLVLFNPNFLIDYKTNIKHIIDDGKYIYIFSVDGTIIKLDTNLKVLKKKKLPFADFMAPSICKKNIYTITSNGYLLKITPELNITVYKTDQFDTAEPLKIKGCKIYNDNKVFFIE